MPTRGWIFVWQEKLSQIDSSKCTNGYGDYSCGPHYYYYYIYYSLIAFMDNFFQCLWRYSAVVTCVLSADQKGAAWILCWLLDTGRVIYPCSTPEEGHRAPRPADGIAVKATLTRLTASSVNLLTLYTTTAVDHSKFRGITGDCCWNWMFCRRHGCWRWVLEERRRHCSIKYGDVHFVVMYLCG